ncbi:hypothetical protein APSETT445_000433 [Aspergillus pseudonomiae]
MTYTEKHVMSLALSGNDTQLCAFGVLACFVGESHHGVGLFSDDIKPEDFQVLSEYMFYHAIVIVLGISLVKVSLALFLLRFASPNKNLKRFIVGALAINIATDFVFATLPAFMFYKVQVNKRTRVSLMGILSLGYLYVISAS